MTCRRLLISVALILLTPADAFSNSAGEFSGQGNYSDWLRAVEPFEDGVDYAQKGKYTMALECYDEAIQIYPLDALFYYNKGIALRKAGRGPESLPVFKKAVELEPEFASAWYNLGNAQQVEHDLPAAESSFRQALKFAPTHMKAWFNLGETLFARKKYSEAKEAFKYAQELPSSDKDKKDIAVYLVDIERLLKKDKPAGEK
jgi:tetratricopeptide (TPR) repeat protein